MAIVSSTDGWPTKTCWKRRSSAASFSMCLRYSSSVVAPIMRSSPRASIGLIMLPASIAPSAAPAPTMVCSSSMKVMTSPSASVISLSTALSRSSNSPRYLAPATIEPRSRLIEPLVLQALGHVALDDAPGEALDDGGLADAGLADEHRVVLRAARQHLDDAADLLVAADDRVELAGAGRLGEVAAVLLERLVLVLGVLARDPVAAAHLPQRGEQLARGRRRAGRPGRAAGARWRGTRRASSARARRPRRGPAGARGTGGPRRRRPWAAWRPPRRPRCAARAASSADLLEDRQDDALLLAEQGGEQVVGGDLGVAARPGPARRRRLNASWVFRVQRFGSSAMAGLPSTGVSRLDEASPAVTGRDGRCGRASTACGQRHEARGGTGGGSLDGLLGASAWRRPAGAQPASSASSSSTFCTPARLRPSLVSSWMRRSCAMSSSL